jgi:hypothetical protein
VRAFHGIEFRIAHVFEAVQVVQGKEVGQAVGLRTL